MEILFRFNQFNSFISGSIIISRLCSYKLNLQQMRLRVEIRKAILVNHPTEGNFLVSSAIQYSKNNFYQNTL